MAKGDYRSFEEKPNHASSQGAAAKHVLFSRRKPQRKNKARKEIKKENQRCSFLRAS